MSEEQESRELTIIKLSLPVVLLILIDIYTVLLPPQINAIPHFNIAVLMAQFICVLVFLKGRICNGQRGRLIRAINYFAFYWGSVWILGLFAKPYSVNILLQFIAGGLMLIIMLKQSLEPKPQIFRLKLAALVGLLALIAFVSLLTKISCLELLQYNLFSQLLVGVILANIVLVVSRNRLQDFIALLPLIITVLLVCNALWSLAVLIYSLLSTGVNLANPFALILYFLLHLLIAGILAFHIYHKQKLSYYVLIFLLFLTATFPLWAKFTYIE
ncbi:hypothetical protein [Mannheimia massilioguelmaensis]|uniref:hypothetical protein n=1 Tax=Mannheimia massilioguelmaensis TaxID=1604354 RepID=UPI0005C847A3|nr:hypothetical protein [Mannheimia massilioguelmaensis]